MTTPKEAFDAAKLYAGLGNFFEPRKFEFTSHESRFEIHIEASRYSFVYVGISSACIMLTSRCVPHESVVDFLDKLETKFARNAHCYARESTLCARRDVICAEIDRLKIELDDIEKELTAKEMADRHSINAALLASAGF